MKGELHHSRIHDSLCHEFPQKPELAADLLYHTEGSARSQGSGKHAHRAVDVLGTTGGPTLRGTRHWTQVTPKQHQI